LYSDVTLFHDSEDCITSLDHGQPHILFLFHISDVLFNVPGDPPQLFEPQASGAGGLFFLIGHATFYMHPTHWMLNMPESVVLESFTKPFT
jgi:hypothetical protein